MEGNGHPNIVDSIPDALATTANYLKKSGWIPGVSWGYEVKLPRGYAGPSGRKARHPVSFWAAKGLTKAQGGSLDGAEAGLLLPSGPEGPRLPRDQEFRRDLRLQCRRGVCAGDLPARRPDRRRRPARHALADRRPRPLPLPIAANCRACSSTRATRSANTDGVIGLKTLQAITDYQTRVGMPRQSPCQRQRAPGPSQRPVGRRDGLAGRRSDLSSASPPRTAPRPGRSRPASGPSSCPRP